MSVEGVGIVGEQVEEGRMKGEERKRGKKKKKLKFGRERKVEQGWDQQIDTCMESQKMKGKK
jgi:hypothetical protein